MIPNKGTMKPQLGFLSLTGYIYLAVALAFIGLLMALKIQSARLDAKSAELEACAARYEETLNLVNKQNKAVETLKSDAQKRTRIARAALEKAREGQGKADAEIARLRSVKPADCAAAVAEVRKGLKP